MSYQGATTQIKRPGDAPLIDGGNTRRGLTRKEMTP